MLDCTALLTVEERKRMCHFAFAVKRTVCEQWQIRRGRENPKMVITERGLKADRNRSYGT